MGKAHWLKLDVNIMQDEKISLIRREERGDSYVLLWVALLCCAMKRESPSIYITKSIPAKTNELAHLLCFDISIIADGLAIFEKYGMIHYDELGAVVITKFCEYQALGELGRKREMAACRVRKHRTKDCNADVTLDDSVTGVTCNAIEEK